MLTLLNRDMLQILQCPNCLSSDLSFKDLKKKLLCRNCNAAYEVNPRGIASFVKPEVRKGEHFNYYDCEYLKIHPSLDFQDTFWKATTVLSMLKKTKITPRSILDVGCGNGEILRIVNQAIKPSFVLGVDLSSKNLLFAFKKNPQLALLQASAESLPLRSKSIDLCLAIDLIEHVQDLDSTLMEINRVSKYLLIKVPLEDCFEGKIIRRAIPDWKRRSGHINFFNQDTIRRALLKNKFKIKGDFLAHTPILLTGFKEASVKSKLFILFHYPFRLLGSRIYNILFPIWYLALCESI